MWRPIAAAPAPVPAPIVPLLASQRRATTCLRAAGANKSAKNGNGKTAAELATLDPRNPVGQDEGLMAALTP